MENLTFTYPSHTTKGCVPLSSDVSKEQYKTKEAEGFVESKFGGSLKNFLVAFRGSDKISKKDMNDLKAWLDELDD